MKKFIQNLSNLTLYKENSSLSKRSFGFLNIAQFFGALNDNLFKYLTIFLLIKLLGQNASGSILFWVTNCFVAPFLLFSSYAGSLADRFSKQKIIVSLKALEILIIVVAYFAFTYQIISLCYFLVFMIAAQSALFGPPKYSIVPELVPRERISKANGLMTSFTYLAIIFGTFLASLLMDISNKNFNLPLAFCLLFSIIGFLSSLFIKPTPVQTNTDTNKTWFLLEAFETIKSLKKRPKLLIALFGSSFFLLIGAFLQLNVIPYALQTLHMSEVKAGYLFTGAAVGIALGASLSGRLIKNDRGMGLSVFTSFVLGSLLLVTGLCTSAFSASIMLFLLGFFGGLYIIPFETFLQANSPDNIRGKIVAASNFLSFVGVLLAPICILFFTNILHFSAALTFAGMGVFTLALFYLLSRLLPYDLLYFVAKRIFEPLAHIEYKNKGVKNDKPLALFSTVKSYFHALLLMTKSEQMHLFVIKEEKGAFDRFINLYKGIHFIYEGQKDTLDTIKKLPSSISLFFFSKSNEKTNRLIKNLSPKLQDNYTLETAQVQHTTKPKGHIQKLYKKKRISFAFKTLSITHKEAS